MRNKIIQILLLLVLVLYAIFYQQFIFSKFMKCSEAINASFILILATLTIYLLGFYKDKSTNNAKDIKKVTIINISFYFIISYALGFVTGFLKTPYSVNSIFDNILFPLLIIIGEEVLRYNFLKHSQDNKLEIVIITLAIIIFDLVINLKDYNFTTIELTYNILTTIIIPLLVKHSALSFISLHAGYRTTILFRVPFDLYSFILPITPDLGDYLTSILDISAPMLLFIYSFRIVDETLNGITYDFKKESFKKSDIPILIIIVILISLISGYFPIQMISIGSGSMSPKIEKGDAVIFNKKIKPKDIRISDIIAYEKNDKLIIHRIVEIKYEENKKTYYTKGDANKSRDNIELEFKDIKGKILFKIPYIGYPSVYLTEKFGN